MGSINTEIKRACRTARLVCGSSIFALAIGAASGSSAVAAEKAVNFTIEKQNLATALVQLSQQADIPLYVSEELARGFSSSAVSGDMSPSEALSLLLENSGLSFQKNALGTYIVSSNPGFQKVGFTTTEEYEAELGAYPDDEKKDEIVELEEVTVTGTLIRGIAPDSSPLRTYDREDIQISGAATAQDFIRTLPQNFGGGSNADIAGLPNDVNSLENRANGSGVNLRGLGSGATLVLLNGHRLAPSSGLGDFVDISLIPASAIARVEVLTDGASSIYGGDAIAGVVNFVLRDDYDGVEASYRYGAVTEGGLTGNRASLTGGKSWNTGNALVVYEYFNQSDLSAADRSFSQEASLPQDLLPSQKRHSVLASASQELSSRLEVRGDLTFSSRDAVRDNNNFSGIFRSFSSSDNLNVSAGGAWNIMKDWFVDFSGTYSENRIKTEAVGPFPSMRAIDADIWTTDVKTSGMILSLPGGDAKLAIGGHFRREGFTNRRVDTDTIERQADRNVYAVFGEVFIPIVGPDNAQPGIKRLELNASGRFDDYSDFGSTINPKVGILWSPIDSISLRGSYSTSFNPPPLGRVGATDFLASVVRTSFLNSVFGFAPGDPSIADVVVIGLQGTAKELDAENSRAFTAGLNYSEEWGNHSLTFEITYFDINFENRLGATPVPNGRLIPDAHNIAFNNPEAFPDGTIIFFPPQSEVDALLNSVDTVFAFPGVDPSDAEIISFVGVVRNLARTKVRGFDFNIAYNYDANYGSLALGLNGTFLDNFQQQGADTTPLVEQVGTLYNPVGLRLRGRAGYSHNGVAANIFVNYTDDYRVDNTPGAAEVSSWTTVDLSLSYDTQAKFDNSILNNMVLRMSILNLFDEDPPAAPSNPQFEIYGFDPANASPLGRFISFEFTKKW